MNRKTRLLTALVLATFAAPPQAARAVGGNPIVLDNGTVTGGQGWSVDISGNLAIVGAPYYQGGQAFIFDVTTGQLLQRLIPSDPASNALFGYAVAIDGNLAVVAAGQSNTAYTFDVTTGQQLQKLVPPGTNRNQFVRDVDISNGRAILGSPEVGDVIHPYGAAYLYDATSGSLLRQFNGPTGGFKREFGGIVAIEGDTLAIRSYADNLQDNVIVYNATTGATQWSFGYDNNGLRTKIKDIAIDGGVVAVGAGTSLYDMPTAYILDRSTGALQRSISTIVSNLSDGYKNQLDISGNRLVVGSWGTYHAPYGYYVGDVHVFDVTTGALVGDITNPFPSGSIDDFAFAVALEGNRLIVGAPNAPTRGFAYSYFIPEPTIAIYSIFAAVLLATQRFKRCRL